MTWWTLRRLQIGPSSTTAAIACTTSVPDHLFCAWAPWAPRRHPRYRIYRGKSHLCGYDYIWDTPNITEQQMPGDTDFHLMALKNLTPSTTYWGYVFAPDGPYGLEVQGPLFNFTTLPPVPGPEPTPAPIYFDIDDPVFRCGNRYTFWANGTWYAFVPCQTACTLWKLVDGSMIRQDQAHEPTPPQGVIWDADSRMQPDAQTIHTCYFCRVPDPGPHLLRYATFDLTTDTWALDEHICTPRRTAFAYTNCSLTLDADLKPHVVYNDYFDAFPEIHYRHRITGLWSTPEAALAIPYKINMYPSLWTDPATDHVHLIGVMNTYEHWYTDRPPGEASWSGPTRIGSCVNLPQRSVAAGVQYAHVAQVGQDWRIDHYEISEMVYYQEDLTDPTSTHANMISGPAPTAYNLIAFRDNDTHLAYIYRPAGMPWEPQVQLEPTNLIVLTAHYAHPDVISCLWTTSPPQNCALYAFYGPWLT